jgi:transcriptional regulator with XRE-family HTH domain
MPLLMVQAVDAAAIRTAREALDLSRDELCSAVNSQIGAGFERWGRPAGHITYSYLCKLENGQRVNASREVVNALAYVLGVTTDKLVAS